MGEIEQERLRICIIATNLFPALLSAIRGFVRYSFSFSSLSRTPHFYGKGERDREREKRVMNPDEKRKTDFPPRRKERKITLPFSRPLAGYGHYVRTTGAEPTARSFIAYTKKQANIPSSPALRSPLSLRNEN